MLSLVAEYWHTLEEPEGPLLAGWFIAFLSLRLLAALVGSCLHPPSCNTSSCLPGVAPEHWCAGYVWLGLLGTPRANSGKCT